MLFFETSAVEGVHVEDSFRELAKQALKRNAEQQYTHKQTMNTGNVKLNNKVAAKEPTSSGMCC